MQGRCSAVLKLYATSAHINCDCGALFSPHLEMHENKWMCSTPDNVTGRDDQNPLRNVISLIWRFSVSLTIQNFTLGEIPWQL